MTDATEQSTVVGVFRNRADAERAVTELHDAGFGQGQIGFLTPGGERLESVEEGSAGRGALAGEGAAVGVVVGGLIGAAASLLIPGIGPVLAGGILTAVLGGAVAGGVLGALVGLGVPEEHARYYESEFKAGRTLVTVRPEGRAATAREILRNNGAYDVENHAPDDGLDRESRLSNPRPGVAPPPAVESAPPQVSEAPIGAFVGRELRVPVAAEELIPHRTRVQSGEVVVSRHVVSEERALDVPFVRDDVQVERVPADRPATSSEPIYDGDTIRIPIVEERLVVEKRPWVVAELVITRKAINDTKTIRETVRRQEVDVRRDEEKRSA